MRTTAFVCRVLLLCFVALATLSVRSASAADPKAPAPLLQKGHPIDWWFVFKFNTSSFPACGGAQRKCIFGGEPQAYASFGQQYAYASSDDQVLKKGSDCAGDTTTDPIGATFDQVYNESYFYVIWNDQFYDDPTIGGCTKECGSPWGHSKGLLAWNSAGEGFVLQVSTPSWPAAGSSNAPRKTDGNTLGCVKDDNVKVSQHFFALKLGKDDLLKVLSALANASVVTDVKNDQVVKNGGPADVQVAVDKLGKKSTSTAYTKEMLSTGVVLISKPSRLRVPPWQMVSAILGKVALRTATWWTNPKIYSTSDGASIGCWDNSLSAAGPVEIATTGEWGGKKFGLTGGSGPNFNHAKLGVSKSGNTPYAIFGDMNQQGSIGPGSGPCTSSQNGRGGTFYVLKEETLTKELTALMKGDTAPTTGP